MVPVWVLNIGRHLIFREGTPKKDHHFDNYTYGYLGPFGARRAQQLRRLYSLPSSFAQLGVSAHRLPPAKTWVLGFGV